MKNTLAKITHSVNMPGPIAPLFTPVIQLVNANVRSRFMNNTTDNLKESSKEKPAL
jgi:hypothetical protein